MTKMIKMSLIAAVAVTGMTSAANAQNLEDAIKGVDVSGYVDYRLENKSVEKYLLKFSKLKFVISKISLNKDAKTLFKALVGLLQTILLTI